jgi:hypothetical protein
MMAGGVLGWDQHFRRISGAATATASRQAVTGRGLESRAASDPRATSCRNGIGLLQLPDRRKFMRQPSTNVGSGTLGLAPFAWRQILRRRGYVTQD